MFTKEGKIYMPVWERILVFFVIAFSISSICALLIRSQKFENSDINKNKVLEEPPKKGSLVLRLQWSALPSRWSSQLLSILPPPYVIISHTVQRPCYNYIQCKKSVQLIQQHHIEANHWSDIAYNFLVGGDGNVYEGRGWDKRGAHALSFNNRSIGIAFIGDFRSREPVPDQLMAAKNFIEHGVEIGKISADYKLLGHRQVTKTESPGEKLYKIIQTWDHWAEIP